MLDTMLAHEVITFDREGDAKRLRRALGCFATGVTVVTTRAPDGKLEALTVNSFASVSLDPPLVLWSLDHRAHSRPSFDAADHFAINVLGAEHANLCRHFATPASDKLAAVAYRPGLGGCPLLDDVLASFECRTETALPQGDHTIFIGRVLRAMFRDGEPLIFSGGRLFGRAAIG